MDPQEALEALFKLYLECAREKVNEPEKVTIKPVDLIVIDFQMPRMTGNELVKKIRGFIKLQNDRNRKVKFQEPYIVVVSGYFAPVLENLLKDLNLKIYFEKPLEREQVLEIYSLMQEQSQT